ncbi:hypothetical protein KUF71_009846 [Frankliniella fusca]|uniref:Uncharacterized protein n=1 Tax=Frankliniella fusca TaxID=407009 RepID=A0AAE1HFU0_9NEOP|nr:hypothetical protein KUF71_009846 [Frankliniella fusca]
MTRVAYIKHKYKDTDTIIKKSTLVKLVNAKCYAMRRQCWDKMRRGDKDSESSLCVRKALPKKTKDVYKPLKVIKSKQRDPSSRRSKEPRREENNKHKHEQKHKSSEERRDSSQSDKNKNHRSSEKDKTVTSRISEKDKTVTSRISEKDKTVAHRSSETDKNERRNSSQKGKNEKHRSSEKGRNEKHRYSEEDRIGKRFSIKRNSLALGSPRKRTPKKNSGSNKCSSFEVYPSENENPATSTPKFGGKRPKPFQGLLQMTFKRSGNESRADNDEQDVKDEEELEDEESEGSGESGPETINSSAYEDEVIDTD